MCCVHGNRSHSSGHASQITDFGEHDWYEDTSSLLRILCVSSKLCLVAAPSCPWRVAWMHVSMPVSGRHRAPLERSWTWVPDGPPDPSSAGVAVQGTSTQTSSSLRVSLMSCFLRARLPAPPPHFLSQISSNEILVCLILSWRVFLRGLGLTQYATWMSHFICQQTLWMVMLPG